MKRTNVLITAASRRVPLVRAFRNAVEKFGGGRVITTDINPLSPALYFGHKHHIVPLTTDRYYIPIIESICDADAIEAVEPAKNPLGFEDNRLRNQHFFQLEDGSDTCSLSRFVACQQTDNNISTDREHAAP